MKPYIRRERKTRSQISDIGFIAIEIYQADGRAGTRLAAAS